MRLFALFLWILCTAFAQTSSTTHTVRPGETLYRIAVLHGVSVEALQVLNGLSDPGQLQVGQVLKLRGKPITTPNSSVLDGPIRGVTLEWPTSTIQGNLAVVRISRPFIGNSEDTSGTAASIAFLKQVYPVINGLALLPIPALQKPGSYPATLRIGEASHTFSILVSAGRFGRFVLQLPASRRALLVPERLRAERLQVTGSCNFNRPRQWTGNFRKPITTNRITDPFGTRRSYDLGKTYSFHEGLDYGIPEGTPVYAPAEGIVGLAQKLFVRGNGITLDHGLGVCSGFWHLSRILVKPGQRVKVGQLIAYSGNTGLSNGPHLHFEIRIRGTPTNPAPWYLAAP
jgi:murein DD-endopeptidase MepM/ murein hydrolase activator NlpD